MGRQPDWLPHRPLKNKTDLNVPFVQEPPDVVRVLILQLAHGAWSTLARLLQLACLALDIRPLLAYEMASAGATGVVLDILCQAPRYHPAWPALSTAGAGLLAALVHCEGGTEAAQPQALRMLLSMLESDLTVGPARQAVATVLHCIVAQRTVHRDKLLAAGALQVLLRVLRRLDVLCDLVAVQEVLWTLVYLTDEGALGTPGATGGYQPELSERLVPLLFLYGMPWHPQVAHVAALTIRALHVHAAGYDAGKDTLRAAGVLSVLVENVRRHSAPYIAAAEAAAKAPRRRGRDAADVIAAVSLAKGQPGHQGGQRPTGTAPAQMPSTRGSFAVGSARPAPHVGCDVHLDGEMIPNGAAETGPYTCSTATALGPWTPWQRLLAVLLISGFVPGLVPVRRRRVRGPGTVVAGPSHGSDSAAAAAAAPPTQRDRADGTTAEGSDDGPLSPVSTIRSELSDAPEGPMGRSAEMRRSLSSAPGHSPPPQPQRWLEDEGIEEGDEAGDGGGGGGAGANESHTSGQAQSAGRVTATAEAAVADGARLVCYGLLLPLLLDAGEEAPLGGPGAAAAAVGGALLRRRLCPLREALATLKTLLCDCEANQLEVSELGLPVLLVQLVAHGDMGLAWQAAEAAVFLSGGDTGSALVSAGAAEEMAYLLEESADMLHGLTLRKQIQVRQTALTAAQKDHHPPHRAHAYGAGSGAGAAGPPAAVAAGRARPAHPQLATAASLSFSHGGAAAAPPSLTDVHVRPSRTASTAGARPQRVYLVGRVPLDFTTSSSCFYGSHDAMSYCDYCTPSAAVKVLLRLMSSTSKLTSSLAAAAAPGVSAFAAAAAHPPPGAAQEAEVCRRFAAAGGMYGILLLLHHEAAGVHHSKLAASLLTMLDMLLVHVPGAQDELRLSGGLGVLTTLLVSLMRPGVMDVYQLRVGTCRTLKLALEGNAANKLTAREHGLLPLLVSLLTVLTRQRKNTGEVVVVDDSGPLTCAILEALAAAAHDSPGTQELLVALGLLHPVCDLLKDERLDGEVRTHAVRTLTAVVNEFPAGQTGALALGAVPAAVGWLDRCCQDAAATVVPPTITGGPGGAAATTVAAAPLPASLGELAETAAALAALLGALLRGGNPHVKSAVVSAGAPGILLQLLRSKVLAAAAAAAEAGESAAAAFAAGNGGVTGLAASALAVLIDGDTDLQNELVSQGGLAAAADIVRTGGAAAPAALQLLTAIVRSNTFAKNTARSAGLPAALVEAVRRCGLAQRAGATAAAAALAELAAGNHANQEAVAVQGGLEVAVELLRDAFAELPLKALTGGGGGGGAAASDLDPDLDADLDGSDSQSRGDVTWSEDGAGGGSRDALAAAVSYTATEAEADAATAASLSRLLRALFGLVSACVELNGGNKTYLRELGGVTLLGQVLLALAEALTAPPPLDWLPYNQRSRRRLQQQQQRLSGDGQGQDPALVPAAPSTLGRFRDAVAASRVAASPAVAAACAALVAVTKESSANLVRLEEQSGLAVALFKLLVATDAATSLAAAFAIEWLVVRSRVQLDAPSRDAFELNLVDVLALALYVPYAPLPLAPPPAVVAAAQQGGRAADGGAAASGGDGFSCWLRQQRQRQQLRGSWYMVVRSIMPPDVLSAVAVRDAAAVLAAVADTADTLDAQLQQRRPPPPPPPPVPVAQGSQQQHPPSQQQQGSVKAIGKHTATHGSLPALATPLFEAISSDPNTGLMVSDLLVGPSAAADAAAGGGGGGGCAAIGPGSQAWWAELAGTAAPAFQRIANGALRNGASGAGGLVPAPTGPAATGAAAAAATAAPAVSATAAAAEERRRQVAWMLFLLAAKSPENRARMRWLVRASLSPLAQQLANAEACRAQLESAGASPGEPNIVQVPAGGTAAVGPNAGGGLSASTLVLESASSLMGRLPVSTGAAEEPSAVIVRSSSPLGAPTSRPYATPPPPPPSRPAAPPRASPERSPLRQQREQQPPSPPPPPPPPPHQPPPHQPNFDADPRQLPYHRPQPPHGASPLTPPLPPHPRPPGRPTSTPSAVTGAPTATATAVRPSSAGSGGAGLLYGRMYGVAATPSPQPATATSVPATPREPYLSSAVDGTASANAEALSGLRFTRLSRTASGSAPTLAPAVAAVSASANTPPRTSLTGAVAAAFATSAPTLAGASAAAAHQLSRSASPGPNGPRVYEGGTTASAAAPPPAGPRALRAQISTGGSSVMSDDDELAMIQQEVALLANTTNALAWGGAAPIGTAGVGGSSGRAGGGQGLSGFGSGGSGGSPATASPLRWPAGRR